MLVADGIGVVLSQTVTIHLHYIIIIINSVESDRGMSMYNNYEAVE